MLVGYARTSTKDQVLDLQLDALKDAGCERVFTDQLSGAKRDRPGLEQVLDFVREGDQLVIWKLDRLGRSIKDLLEIAETLEKKKVELKSLTDNIDTSTPMARFFFHMMGALAQMERELAQERVKAGLEAARRRGRTGGRPKKLTEERMERAQTLLAAGFSVPHVAKQLGIGASTLYARLKEEKRG